SVHQRWGRQVGTALRPGAVVAARLRRAGTRAFKRAHRTISAAGCARQLSDLPTFERGPIFSPLAPPSSATLAQAACHLYTEEHASPPGCVFTYRGLHS